MYSMLSRKRIAPAVALGLLAVGPAEATAANATMSPWWKNCTELTKKYPHGIGKFGARDHTTGTPVTNFRRSNSLYELATMHNRGLDRDQDGIACETR